MSATNNVSNQPIDDSSIDFGTSDLDSFLLNIEMPSNGQGDYNRDPDSAAPVRAADDLDELLDEIIAKPPPQLEVIHDYENLLTSLVTRMIILTDISETQELLASASAYYLKMLEENAQTTYDYDYLYDCVYIINDFFNLCEGIALKDWYLSRGDRLSYTQNGNFNNMEYQLSLTFSHTVDDHACYTFTHKFKKGQEQQPFDHRKAIENHYRLPREEPLIEVHLEMFKKGLIFNEDDNAPVPETPKVPMHIMYPGLRMPTSLLPRGVERIMVAEHFTKDDGSCKSACGTYISLYLEI